MALAHADKLIERAEKGEKLSVKERRHCIAYIQATRPDMTNTDMADLFQVSERMIRIDKDTMREQRAKAIKEEDIGLILADISLQWERQIRDIEKSKSKAKLGSRAYLDHCKSLTKLTEERVRLLQDLGYYPKNLGNMTVEKYDFKAIVTQDGSVKSRPVDLIKAESAENEDRSAIDAEFEDVEPAQLPAPATPNQ